MTTTVTITNPAAETVTLTPPAAVTPTVTGGTHPTVTLSQPNAAAVTITEPNGLSIINVSGVPTVALSPVTPAAVSLALATPVTASLSVAQAGAVAPTITGQGVQGVPGTFSALKEYWLSDYGGGPNKSATENNTAFQAILNAGGASTGSWYANINEGGMIRFGGPCDFSSEWAVPKHWGIQGISMTLSALIPRSTTAQLTFSWYDNSGYRLAKTGNFSIDGQYVHSTVPLLSFGKMGEGEVENINVINAYGTGIEIDGTQNVAFENVNAQLCGGSGMVLDWGAGGNTFTRCEIEGNGRYNLELKGTGPYQSSPPGTTPCANNTFIGCILEHGVSTTLGMAYIGAGLRNRFLGCVFAYGDAGAGVSVPLVTVEVAGSLSCLHTEFASCGWSGNGTLVTALSATGSSSIEYTGTQVYTNCTATPNTFGASVTVEAGVMVGGAALPQSVRVGHNLFTTIRVTRTGATDTALEVFQTGDSATAPHFRILGDGTFAAGPGGSSATDVNFRRAGGALGARWKTDQQMCVGTGSAGTGLRVGDGDIWVKHQTATTTWDAPSVNDGTFTSTTVALTGAAVGDIAHAALSVAVPAGALLGASVTAADTVTVTLVNHSGAPLDLASGTLRVTVDKH